MSAIEITYADASVVQGLKPILRFQVNLKNNATQVVTVLNFTANVNVIAPKGQFFIDRVVLPAGTAIGGNSTNVAYLDLILDSVTVEKIEQLRGDGELQFNIDYTSVVGFSSGGGAVPIMGGTQQVGTSTLSTTQVGGAIRTPSGQLIRIPKSDWVEKILPSFGLHRIRLLEIPDFVMPGGFDAVTKNLDDAQRLFGLGDWDDVLDNCRKALEEFKTVLKNLGHTTGEKDEIDFKSIFKKDAGKNMEEIFRNLWQFSQKGAHSGSNITRLDAQFCLLTTYTLLQTVLKKLKP